jgi:hypothetical protein
MLQIQDLTTELQRFADASVPIFAGSPTTRDDARQHWAHAFRIYFAKVTDSVGSPLTPPQASIQVTFADDVEHAFHDQLQLAPALSAQDAAADLADAWHAAMRAIKAGLGGTVPPSTTVHAFSKWTPTTGSRDVVDDRRDQLATTLAALFTAPAIVAAARLGDIAQAFHAATSGLVAVGSVSPITYS